MEEGGGTEPHHHLDPLGWFLHLLLIGLSTELVVIALQCCLDSITGVKCEKLIKNAATCGRVKPCCGALSYNLKGTFYLGKPSWSQKRLDQNTLAILAMRNPFFLECREKRVPPHPEQRK